MATANNINIISELDFNSIKDNLIEFLKSQEEFSDYEFKGSNLSRIIDLLAYNDHYMAYYLNMIANEMYLRTTLIRNNAIERANELNYTPRSMVAPTATINLVITPDPNETATTAYLPKYSQFLSETINGKNYTFITTEGYNTVKANSLFTFSNVQIKQADVNLITFTKDPLNTSNSFIIPTANIDTSSMAVSVFENETGQTYTYLECTNVSDLDGNSRIYFLEAAPEYQYKIYFGDGILGKNLKDNDQVSVNYLITSGPYSNFANNFTLMNPISGNLGPMGNSSVIPISAALNGDFAEGINSIKRNAPLFYVNQNKAHTENDYKIILLRNYQNIDSIAVWGGENNNPPVYGMVFISIKPKNNYYLTNIEKDKILNNILKDKNIVTVKPKIIDPEYTYVYFNLDVYYNPKLTSFSQNQISGLISQSVLSYGTNQLGKFDSSYKLYTLLQYVVNSEKSILNANVKTILQKRFQPSLGQIRNYTFYYNTPLKKGTYTNKLYTSPTFQLYNSNGELKDCFIEEIPLSSQGISNIFINNPGFGFKTTPTIQITGDGVGANAFATIVNGSIQKITIDNPGEGYTIANVNVIGDGYNASLSASMETTNGVLRTYYIDSSNKYILNSSQGTIDYINGIITLNNFAPIDVNNNDKYLGIYIEPRDSYIPPNKNNILVIDNLDSNSILVNMIQESTS